MIQDKLPAIVHLGRQTVDEGGGSLDVRVQKKVSLNQRLLSSFVDLNFRLSIGALASPGTRPRLQKGSQTWNLRIHPCFFSLHNAGCFGGFCF